jgi:hemoglobin-like flavoprotein
MDCRVQHQEDGMSLQVDVLESSFQAIAPNGEAFVADFYDRLFVRFPETRTLFPATDMPKQHKKLLAALVLTIQNLRKPDVLAEHLKELGKRHVHYAVKPEHYPMVGAALLETFAAFLGERWTPEYQAAWADAYGAITNLMLEGAKNASSA